MLSITVIDNNTIIVIDKISILFYQLSALFMADIFNISKKSRGVTDNIRAGFHFGGPVPGNPSVVYAFFTPLLTILVTPFLFHLRKVQISAGE